jgi:amino acid transporter
VNSFPTSLFVPFSFLLAPVIAGFVASVLCGLSILRRERPPWFHAFLSILLGIFSSLLAIFGSDVFSPAYWPGRIPEQWDSFLIVMAASIPFSVVVALIVVALFRERFKRLLSLAERRALRRQRRQRGWLRVRWFNLFASSVLMVCLTGCLVWAHSAPVAAGDTDAADDFPAAFHVAPRNPTASAPQTRAPHAKPLVELSAAAAVLSPFCVLGLAVSGGWLALTVTYWRGYFQVRPRHHRHFTGRHHSHRMH